MTNLLSNSCAHSTVELFRTSGLLRARKMLYPRTPELELSVVHSACHSKKMLRYNVPSITQRSCAVELKELDYMLHVMVEMDECPKEYEDEGQEAGKTMIGSTLKRLEAGGGRRWE